MANHLIIMGPKLQSQQKLIMCAQMMIVAFKTKYHTILTTIGAVLMEEGWHPYVPTMHNVTHFCCWHQ
jgi:hypothetical protein